MNRISLILVASLLPVLAVTAAVRPAAGPATVTMTPAATAAVTPASADKTRILESYGRIPLYFEKNSGQTDAQVQYLARGAGYALFLTPDQAVLSLHRSRGTPAAPEKFESAVVRARLVGVKKNAKVLAEDALPGKSNYFIGNDRAKWRTDIAQYAKIRYQGVYPGVDLVYYGNQQQLEYDFVVAPGADPKAIRLSYSKASKLNLDTEGNLHIASQGSELIQHKPVVYQTLDGKKQTVEGRFKLVHSRAKNTEVAFALADYDHARELVIDPVLTYSTYLGGNGDEAARAIAVDSSGFAYMAGDTVSTNFPAAPKVPLQASYGGRRDAFVAKFSADGSQLLYSTYLGGADIETGAGIAVDSGGNAYVAGQTDSTDFPVTPNALQSANADGANRFADAYVAKLSADGSRLIYSTYVGGHGNDFVAALAVDSNGAAYVAGTTVSTSFPTTANSLQKTNAGGLDAYVAVINFDGTALLYATYLGGSGNDDISGIAVDNSGNAYVAGSTGSTNFPTLNPFQAANSGGFSDGFVAKLNTAGSALIYSTYLGDSGNDGVYGIAVDGSGNAYVSGVTTSTNFPTQNPLQATNGGGPSDGFVAKLDATGSALVYSTYLGGSGTDQANRIAVDSSGNAYVAGSTDSTNFPTQIPFQAANGGGSSDGFVTKLNPAGSALLYSTYLGGSGNDSAFAIAIDSSGSAYVAGSTDSTNFPTQNPLQAANAGTTDAFVAKLANAAGPPAATVTIAANPTTITLGASSALTWSSADAASCVASGAWAGNKAVSGTENVTPAVAGSPAYTLTCTGAGGSGSGNATATVTVNPATTPPPPSKSGGGAFGVLSLLLGLPLAILRRRRDCGR